MSGLGIEIKNMHSLKIDEVKGDIELPTSVYGNRSITLDTLAEFIGTGGGGSGDVTQAQLQQEANARIAGDSALDARVTSLEGETVSIDEVTGVSSVGLQVAKASTAAAARVAIGAGTSNLQIGTTATTAKAGNWTPPDVTSTTNGLMLSQDKVKLDSVEAGAQVNPTLKTINNASLIGSGNIELPTVASVTSLQTSVANLEADVTSLDTRVTTLENNPTGVTLKTINGESLEGAGDILLVKQADYDTKQQAQDTALDDLETVVDGVIDRVEALENTPLAEFKTINGEALTGAGDIVLPTVADVEAVDDDLQAYKGVVDPQLTTLTTDLSNLNTEVNTLTTEVESQEVDISNLDARVEVLETKTHTDEHVKMTSSGVAGYLADFVDGTSLVNNSGKLTVEAINGVQATKDELNYLQGATSNIQDQINDISSVGVFKGAVNNLNELYNISPAPNVGDYYIVLEDSDHSDVTTIYMFSDSGFQFLGEFTAEIRDFETDPLNLETEATGVLPIAHIPTGNTDETVALGNHTHANATQSQAGFLSTVDKTKLDGIATEATKNDTDANLRDRSTHTGSQSFTTLSDVATPAQIPELDAAKITTGTFAVERIPVGTTETTVASGNHEHAIATELVAGFMSAMDKKKLDAVNPLTTDSPVINISDPPSQEKIQESFDKILAALEKIGLFTNNTHLFMNGEQGVWFDPNDLSTLFQDAAGTIPVTAVGQPVGLMMDKSGNNNHAKQEVDEHRPTLKQNPDTGAYFLYFDGLGDFFKTDDIDFSVTSEISMFTAVRNLSTSRVVMLETSLNPGTYDGSFGMYVDPGNRYVSYSRGTQIIAATITAQRDYSVLLSQFSLLEPFVSVKDQGATAINRAEQGGTTYLKHPLYIGKRGGNVTYSAMTADFYGALIVSRLTVLNENNKTMSALNLKMEKLG